MLTEILKKFQNGESMSSSDMAAELGTTEELVLMMSEELARQGYLEMIDPCQSGCSSCPENKGCGGRTGRMWLSTGKGKKSI